VLRFENIGVLYTMDPALAADPVDDAAREAGRIADAVLVADHAAGRIVAVGPRRAVAPAGEGDRCVDLGGAAVLPGLVECHTHVVYGGDRLLDFTERTSGVAYEDIARRGGGIQTTVRATRAASEDELVEAALARLDALLAGGVTTVEVKSGYGLDTESELKMLRVVRRLGREHPADLVATFLGAHTVPTAFGVTRERYLDEVVHEMLPAVAAEGLAEFCDVFCEETAFSVAESRRVLLAGRAHGLRPKLHADQRTNGGGALLAAEVGAVSADHLDHVDAEGIRALAAAGTTAVLLPGATLYLGGTRHAPARALRAAGVPVALSTDSNPGSCPTTHLFLMATLGCVQLGLSPVAALRAVTVEAARALGRAAEMGCLRPGALADLVVLRGRAPEQAVYELAGRPVREVWKRGRLVFGGPARE
jgi:imidazolonepropionase